MSTPTVSEESPTDRIYTIKALTDIWTGDANRRGGRFITTGLLGPVRWWFEVVVRGLGGSACDPSDPNNRCPRDSRVKPTESGSHCAVCEFFGYTGWARKFRFQLLDANECVKQDQIKRGETFKLLLTELRATCPEEWALLDLTLRLIAEYGAIGGRTVFKPSDGPGLADLGLGDFEEKNGQLIVARSRSALPLQQHDVLLQVAGTPVKSRNDLENTVRGKAHGEPAPVTFQSKGTTHMKTLWYGKRHHQDLGLITITGARQQPQITEEQLRQYVNRIHWRRFNHNDFAWGSLDNFWCVKGRYLARQDANTSTFNRVIGREEQKNRSQRLRNNLTNADRWLAGCQQESKKVFSFEEPEEARRTFGFVKPGLIDFDAMKAKLKAVWPDLAENELLKGDNILSSLLRLLSNP